MRNWELPESWQLCKQGGEGHGNRCHGRIGAPQNKDSGSPYSLENAWGPGCPFYSEIGHSIGKMEAPEKFLGFIVGPVGFIVYIYMPIHKMY